MQQTIYGIFYGLFVLSFSSLILVFFGGNTISKALRNFFFAFVFIQLFSLLLFYIFVLLDYIRRLVYLIFQVDDLTKSNALISIGLFITTLPPFLFIAGMILGPHRYKIHEVTIAINKLPAAFENFKIVNFSH